jgi:hypothetical protein
MLVACIVLSPRLLLSVSLCFSLFLCLSLPFLTHAIIGFLLFACYATLHYRYTYFSSFNCRWCPPDMNVAETAAILGTSQTVADWEKAFCDQVTGSGLFAGVQGCRILTTDSMETAVTAQVGVELEDESPSADDSYGRKTPGKDTGKLTETKITVFLATEEALGDSEGPDGLALAFLEDDLTYSFNKVQEGSDLLGVSSHFIGMAPEDASGDLLFPELSKSLRGSGLGYYRG